MATQKPISTISYNTETFLKEKLDSWVDAHIIQAYMYIVHIGEDGDKDHIHVRVEPNKKLDPMDLSDALKEYVGFEDKPRKCRPWRPSVEEDWFLYAVHDEQYLKIKYGGGDKGEKIPYKWQDIKASEYYDIQTAWIRAKAKLEHTSVNMATRMQNGENPIDLIMQGENVYSVNAIARALYQNDYNRLQSKYSDLSNDYNLLSSAISNSGLMVVIENDRPMLVPITESEELED